MDKGQVIQHTLLKADEIDTDGSLVQKPPPDSKPPRSPPNKAPLDTIGLQQTDGSASTKTNGTVLPARPALRREVSVPAPQQPPPPAPPRTTQDVWLPQVEDLASQLSPGVEPAPYDFEYEDYSSMKDEIEDFFSYSEEEQGRLEKARATFEERWASLDEKKAGWETATADAQCRFLAALTTTLGRKDTKEQSSALLCLLYLVLGCWGETSRTAAEDRTTAESHEQKPEKSRASPSDAQLSAIKRNVHLVVTNMSLASLFEAIQGACSDTSIAVVAGISPVVHDGLPTDTSQYASWAAKIILYVVLETAIRDHEAGDDRLRQAFLNIQPSLLHTLIEWLAILRWDESANVPSCKLLIIFWKAILLTMGGTPQIATVRAILEDPTSNSTSSDDHPQITASPLDYHVFRQEIISKYPAFEPPQPLFPFEPEHNSILPTLEDQERTGDDSDRFDHVNGVASIGTSILHHPVHIATPAPSPPPSPAGPGGKGVKKQNYQTNQNFPFLYPPLDASSNEIGGKGSTAVQDLLVGRKWSGSDIPTSILEAANLFAERMRATRAMKQLWEERIRFMKHEKGKRTNRKLKQALDKDDAEPSSLSLTKDHRQRLQAVEDFYRMSLPNLQSLVTVLLRVLLQTVTALAIQPALPVATNASPSTAQAQEQDTQARPVSRGNSNPAAPSEKVAPLVKIPELSPQDFDRLRIQEIMVKAVSNILLLLLNWFKLSHVLKFEYLSQLLFDSNYLTLTLKLFTHQELERAVSIKRERRESNFFEWCNSAPRPAIDTVHSPQHSISPGKPSLQAIASSDQTAPRSAPPPPSGPQTSAAEPPPPPPPPAVDELGLATTYIPNSPITTFSFTAFVTIINTLRIVQKVIKSKPHRQLTMVQLKYSNVLRKALKVPQPDVRLYALKVIKGQVPYCHRKWRQGNMRVITAIYLHCRPSLRDEWLAGCDVDQEVGEALPQERALRALTYWYNVRRYPKEMAMPPIRQLQQKNEETLSTTDVRDDDRAEDDDSHSPHENAGDTDNGDGEEIDRDEDEYLNLDDLDDLDLDDEDLEDEDEDDVHEEQNLGRQLAAEPDFFLQELEKMDLPAVSYRGFRGHEEDKAQAQMQSEESAAVEGW